MLLPNRWSPGSIFALSGAAAVTDWAHPFIAAPEAGRLALLLRLPAPCSLVCHGATPDDLDPEAGVVAGEVIDVTTRQGGRWRVTWHDCYTLIGDTAGGLTVALSAGEPTEGCHVVCRTAGERFAVGYDWASADTAAARAEAGLAADLEAVLADRLEWLRTLNQPRFTSWEERCYRKACAVLRVNAESPQGRIPCRWTTPDRWPHRHLWLWDSAFQAIGLRNFDPDLAEDAIAAVCGCSSPDGLIEITHAPDPAVGVRGVTQPPILAWAARKVYALRPNREFVQRIYEPLTRYVAWDLAHRGWPNGLLGWHLIPVKDHVSAAGGGESGWDNSPRFDPMQPGPMMAVDMSCQMQQELYCLAFFADLLGHQDAAREYRLHADLIGEAINEHLWDEETGFYYDRDGEGKMVKVKAASGLLPLWSGAASPAQADRLLAWLTNPDVFWRPLPVPTVAADEPSYSDDMWRGPVWMNINLMLLDGLRENVQYRELRHLAERMVEEMVRWYRADGVLYEYYDQEARVSPSLLHRKGGVGSAGSTGFGVIKDYGWTAAAMVDLAHQEY